MSILRVANLQFNASGTKRIDYDAVVDDGIIKISADAVRFPVGDNGTRPPSQPGLIRYNSDVGYMEFGGPTKWIQVASNSVYDVANAAYAVSNSALNAANSVNVIPSYNTVNSSYASINSNWTVTNTVYGVANAAFASANNVGPQLAPAYNTANAAFGVANTALQNTNVTLAGNLTVTGNVVANKQVTVTYTPATSVNAAITTAAANTQGGTGYADFLKVTNLSGGTNPNKTFRLNSTGGFEIINSAYTATIFTLDNNGILATAPRGITSSSMPAGSILQVQQGSSTAAWSSSSTGSWVATGLTVSITPTSSSSKILVSIQLSTGQSSSGWATLWGVQRGGVVIGGGASLYGAVAGVWIATDSYQSDNQLYGLSQSYLDSPATTSAITYQVYYYGEGNTGYLNRTPTTGTGTNYATGISTITAMEIAQ